jgi:hypothetical protein
MSIIQKLFLSCYLRLYCPETNEVRERDYTPATEHPCSLLYNPNTWLPNPTAPASYVLLIRYTLPFIACMLLLRTSLQASSDWSAVCFFPSSSIISTKRPYAAIRFNLTSFTSTRPCRLTTSAILSLLPHNAPHRMALPLPSVQFPPPLPVHQPPCRSRALVLSLHPYTIHQDVVMRTLNVLAFCLLQCCHPN